MKLLNLITLILLIVGGLNWGLVGLLNFDLVAALFGAGSILAAYRLHAGRPVCALAAYSAFCCPQK